MHPNITNNLIKQKKMTTQHTSPDGSSSAARRFIEKPRKLGCNHMRRLAAAHAPSGGFWEKPRNMKKIQE